MGNNISKKLYWTPRVLSIIFICFLALMSLDVFGSGLNFWQTIVAFFIHNLPALFLLVVLIISWKHEIVGGVGFILAGLIYIALVMRNPFEWYYLSWVIQISGVAFAIGALFLVGWFKKNQKGNSKLLFIILTLIVGITGYFISYQKQGTLFLSADKKDIIVEDRVLLSIDDNAIFNWFKTESQLCDGDNLTSTPDRKAFCEDKSSFKKLTRFTSIVISPDKMEIGFTIESDTLSPDKVVGIFLRSTNELNLLTSYYLGNEFISFSPSGTHFVYKGNCWEAMCGLFIIDSKTLNEKTTINNPEFADYRMLDAEFIQWISDNEVEYKLKSINSDDVKVEKKSF